MQALEIAADPRVHSVVIHSSGIFETGKSPIPGITITKEALAKLHSPTIYILGGESDIAYRNGMDDYQENRLGAGDGRQPRRGTWRAPFMEDRERRP